MAAHPVVRGVTRGAGALARLAAAVGGVAGVVVGIAVVRDAVSDPPRLQVQAEVVGSDPAREVRVRVAEPVEAVLVSVDGRMVGVVRTAPYVVRLGSGGASVEIVARTADGRMATERLALGGAVAPAVPATSAPSAERRVELIVGEAGRDGGRTLGAVVRGGTTSITTVEFRRNAVLLGTATEDPWTIRVGPLGAGDHVLTATARDATGRTWTSAGVPVGSSWAGSEAGVVRFVVAGCCPVAEEEPVRLSLAGAAGGLSKVEYLLDGEVVASSSRGPLFAVDATFAAGSGTLTARGIDLSGRRVAIDGEILLEVVAVGGPPPAPPSTTAPPTTTPTTTTAATTTTTTVAAPTTTSSTTAGPSTTTTTAAGSTTTRSGTTSAPSRPAG
jgi:hypothetical protein